MRTGNQAWDALLGALVGVVRAEQKNAKTVETDRVLFEGFAALFVFHKAVFALGEDWSPEELEEMLETLN